MRSLSLKRQDESLLSPPSPCFSLFLPHTASSIVAAASRRAATGGWQAGRPGCRLPLPASLSGAAAVLRLSRTVLASWHCKLQLEAGPVGRSSVASESVTPRGSGAPPARSSAAARPGLPGPMRSSSGEPSGSKADGPPAITTFQINILSRTPSLPMTRRSESSAGVRARRRGLLAWRDGRHQVPVPSWTGGSAVKRLR